MAIRSCFDCRLRSIVTRTLMGLTAWALLVLSSAPARAQADAGSAVEGATGAAARAEQAAAEARAILDQIRAERGAGEAEPPVPEPATVETPAAASTTTSPATRDLDAAVREAEAAAEEAREAAKEARVVVNEARRQIESLRARYGRPGFLIGVAGFWAPENFDTDLDIDDSRGLAAVVGYRFGRYVSLELRGEYLDAFDVSSDDPALALYEAELDGYVITVGPKIYPFAGSLQPFVGFGVGAMHAEIDGTDANGAPFDRSETDAVFRFAGGLDYFLSENLVLNLEAAYIAPGGDLSNIDYGSLGGGVTFRF
jgi:opacity protein-like surface antigen